MKPTRATPALGLSVSVVVAALAGLVGAFAGPPLHAAEPSPAKQAAVAAVDRHGDELVGLADRIWEFAETALREHRSSALLADYAEAQGFTVERGVAGMPTAFVASYGSGRPVIAILGEYDALPGLSQKAEPEKAPLVPGAPGHGCGHNLFGAASLGAAVAVKERIAAGDLAGTVRFYGTPAEESVGGKLYMIRAGLFQDVDVVLAWHPEDEIRADTDSSQAMVDFVADFHGKAAHAAFDPWNGRSALDALELFTHAVNMMREHVRPTVRMHYVITDGGDVPNVVPEHAQVWCWMRDSTHQSVDQLLERGRKMVAGAAMAAEVEGELKVQSGDYEMLVNWTGARLLQANLELARPDRVHRPGAGVRAADPARHRGRGEGAGRLDQAAGGAPRRAGGRLHRRRRRLLGGAHPPPVGDHRPGRLALARLAGGRLRTDVDRPQGDALRRQGPRRHHGRPLSEAGAARAGQEGVRREDGGQGVPRLHPARPAAAAGGVIRRRQGTGDASS